MKCIKVIVDTGFINAIHEDVCELPEGWDSMSDGDKEIYLQDLADELRNEVVDAYAEVVEP